MKKFTKFTFGALFVFGALAIASCGGNNDAPTSGDNTSGAPVTTSTSADHQHNYQFSSFEWIENPGAYLAKAVYNCTAGDSTVKYEATVTKLDTSTPSTCTVAGVNKWKASYDGHEETKDETLAKLAHNNNGYGFCSVCHEWLGLTATGLEWSKTVAVGDKEYVRFAVLPGRLYYYTIDETYFGSGTAAFFLDNNFTPTMIGEEYPVEVPNNSDGYAYFVLAFAKAGNFEMSLELVAEHAHSANGLGFCSICGKYMGETYQNGGSGINMQTLSTNGQNYFRVRYFTNEQNCVFMSFAEDAMHNPAKFSLYYFDTDHNPTLLDENITDELFINGQLDIHANDRYIYVVADFNDAVNTGNVYLAQLGFNGYDMVPAVQRYHGVTINPDTTQPILVDFVTKPYPDRSRYVIQANGLVAGNCYHIEGTNFAFYTLEAYRVHDGNLNDPVPLYKGEYFTAPAAQVVFLIYANTNLTSSNNISLTAGHFQENDNEHYQGFYCWAHEDPAWLGEAEDMEIDHTYNLSLAENEEKYFRIDRGDLWSGDGLRLSTYSGFEAVLYYFDSSELEMVDIEEDHYVWEELPDNCAPVAEGESTYYYLYIKKTGSAGNISFQVNPVHNGYNAAGVCRYCLDYKGEAFAETDGVPGEHEYKVNTVFVRSFPAKSTTYMSFEIPQGHKWSITAGGVVPYINMFVDSSQCEVKFYCVDDEGYAHEITDVELSGKKYSIDYAQDWLNTHEGLNGRLSGDLYMVVTNKTNDPINDIEFTIVHNHVYTHGLCACGSYNGQSKTMNTNSSFSLSDGQTKLSRFAFNAGKQYSVTLTPHGLTQENLNFYYVNLNGGFVALNYEEMASADTSDYMFTIPADAESSDDYIYMELHNGTGGTLVVSNFIVALVE